MALCEYYKEQHEWMSVYISPLAHAHVLLFDVTQQLICHPANHLPWLPLGRLQHRLKVLHQPILILRQNTMKMLLSLHFTYYLIRIKSAQQSPAVHSCLQDSSRTASKLTPLGLDQMAIRRKRWREQIQWGSALLSHWLLPPTYKLTTRVKLCSGRMPYVCTSLSLLTLGSSGSPSLIFCTTTAWHASMPVGSDALSSYTIRGGRLGSGINLKGGQVGKKGRGRRGEECFISSTDKLGFCWDTNSALDTTLVTIHFLPESFDSISLKPDHLSFPPHKLKHTGLCVWCLFISLHLAATQRLSSSFSPHWGQDHPLVS